MTSPKKKSSSADKSPAVEQLADAVLARAAEMASTSSKDEEQLGLAGLLELPVQVSVEVGRTRMSLADIARLGPGSTISLEREAHEPIEVLVNGKTVARGEIVTVEGRYGVRVTRVLGKS